MSYYSSFGVWRGNSREEYKGVITFKSPNYKHKWMCRCESELEHIIHKALVVNGTFKTPSKVNIEQTIKGPDCYEQYFEYGYIFSNKFIFQDSKEIYKSSILSKDEYCLIEDGNKSLFIRVAPVPEFKNGETGIPEICDDKQTFTFKIDGYQSVYDYDFKAQFAVGDIIQLKKSATDSANKAKILLCVTDIVCKRLQDITVSECIAYGVEKDAYLDVGEEFCKGIFSSMWDSKLSSKKKKTCSWNANPWVLLYKFEAVKK